MASRERQRPDEACNGERYADYDWKQNMVCDKIVYIRNI